MSIRTHLERRPITLGWIAGGVLLVVAGLTGMRYHNDLQRARQQINNMGSQVIDTPCGPIEYAVQGEGAPVLVIHGNGGGFDQGLGLAKDLLGEGFQVIAPSRFGYLRSPVPESATPAMQADAYACLLDALKVDKVAIFTTSAGVTSSVQFAMRHPDRVTALVLHSPNAPGKVEMKVPPRQVFSAMFHSDFAIWAMTTYFAPSMYSFVGVPKDFALDSTNKAYAEQALRSISPASDRADGILFDTFVSNPEINTYDFSQVQTPTLVISAVDDPMALHENARTLAERISGARLVAISNGGHLLLGHGEEVKSEITRFLNQSMVYGEK